jgi:hypothetical protein
MGTTEGSIETLWDARRKVHLQVRTEVTKYLFLSCQQNANQNHNMRLEKEFFENAAKLKYLEKTASNKKI